MFARPEPTRARPRRPERPDPSPMLFLFGAAFAVRAVVAWLAASGAVSALAMPEWLSVAANLARGAGLSLDAPGGPTPTASVPPFTPWIASGVLKMAGANPLALRLTFAGLGALVPLAVASFGMAVFGGNAGRWAGWICALDPFLILTPECSDAVAPLTFVVATLGTAAWVKTPRPGRALGVGILWGFAALTHPSALAIPAGVVAWAWIPLGLTVANSDRLRQALLVLVGVAVVVAPWTLRNATSMNAFVPVSTGNGVALLAANSHRAWTDAALRGAPLARAELVAEHPEVAARDEVSADRAGYRLTLDHAREHLAEALAVLGPRTIAFAIAPLAPFEPWLAVAAFGLLPWVVWGAVRAVTGPRRLFQSFAVLAIAWFLMRALVYGATGDLRVPVEPLIALLAGVGAEDVRRRVRARSSGFTVIEGRR